MPGGIGKGSKSQKSYKGTCEEVDVKVFGTREAKKHAKKIHRRALRENGKQQSSFDNEDQRNSSGAGKK